VLLDHLEGRDEVAARDDVADRPVFGMSELVEVPLSEMVGVQEHRHRCSSGGTPTTQVTGRAPGRWTVQHRRIDRSNSNSHMP
jgi:hypothetical protein